MTAPWLSVLMPTYNGAAYLPAALDSVLAQQDPRVECIAVDDGSTDGTAAILDDYRDRLDLQVICQPHAGNWVASTNQALMRARGEYACLLHQDDIWMPGRIARLKDAIARHPDVDLFLHPSWFIDSGGRRLGQWRCPLPTDPEVLDADTVLPRLLVQNFISIPAPIFRTAAARDAGALDEALWYTADWDFWLKLAAAGGVVYLPDPLAGFRVHTSSQTNQRSFDLNGFRRQQELVLERHLRIATSGGDDRIAGPARLSVVLNTVLAARYHGQPMSLLPLISVLWTSGPMNWVRYLRYSRIFERVIARIRMQGRPSAANSP